MGHKGDIEARYSTNKGRLPPPMVEEMRLSYKKCAKLIQVASAGLGEEDPNVSFRKVVLVGVGFKGDYIEKVDIGGLTEEAFQGMVKEKLLGSMANIGARQKVIPANDVEDYIPKGWEFVASLPNGRAIVKLPR